MTLVDDHAAALSLANLAGQRLVAVRAELRRDGVVGAPAKKRGDAAAQEVLAEALAASFPQDSVLSEEAADDSTRLEASRVWIIDPLDGTREFSEFERDDWAVHVALWEEGELKAGAVALPARGLTYSTSGTELLSSRPPSAPLRLAVSRSRPPSFVVELAEMLGAELVPMGSAGVKAMSVVAGDTDAYVHAGGQYEWDSAAPVAVARKAGLHTSRLDGSPLEYNRRNPWLPDLIVCRPAIAARIIAGIAPQPS